jgi:PBSX family phage terminase large subunit
VSNHTLTFDFEPEIFVPCFVPLLEAEEATQLLTGNRGSGKSVFLYQKAIIFALTKKYFRLVYARKIADTIRGSTFQGLKDVINEWGLTAYFIIRESDMKIICKHNGNMLIAYGLDKPEKLKGIKDPTHVLWDEMTEGTFADYAHLQGILRTDKVKQTQFWGSFNPEYDFWGRDYFFADNENDDIPIGIVPSKRQNTLIFKASFKDNPFIDAKAYEKKLRDLADGDENYLTVWIDGNWGQAITGKEFFTNFKKSAHVMSVPFIPGKPTHNTFDFNVVPYMTQLCVQVNLTDTEFQIRIFKEYCLEDPFNSTEAVCKRFLEDYGSKIDELFYYGDASGESKIAGKGNVVAFDDVRSVYRPYLHSASKRVLRKNPRIMKRRDFMNRLLSRKIIVDGLVAVIMIDDSCRKMIDDMQKLKVGVDGKLKKKVKDPKNKEITYELYGHTSDALEYLICKLLEFEFKNDSPGEDVEAA